MGRRDGEGGFVGGWSTLSLRGRGGQRGGCACGRLLPKATACKGDGTMRLSVSVAINLMPCMLGTKVPSSAGEQAAACTLGPLLRCSSPDPQPPTRGGTLPSSTHNANEPRQAHMRLTAAGMELGGWLKSHVMEMRTAVRSTTSLRMPQSARQPNQEYSGNSKGASQMPSPQGGSTHTFCVGVRERAGTGAAGGGWMLGTGAQWRGQPAIRTYCTQAQEPHP